MRSAAVVERHTPPRTMLGQNQQIVTQEGQFMRKCYNQRCASKIAKDTYALIVVTRFIKVYNNGFNHGFN